tara:strand:- start:14 stop:805 length:792 start_codon:yes stop_codon:yes gene_type:complete
MRNLLVIPARYESSRFPGKPLVPIRGADGKETSLIERTWKLAQEIKTIEKKIIATDDIRIKEFCENFGAEVYLTSDKLRNGSERVAEALTLQKVEYDIVVNLQGDAPLTPSWVIQELVNELENSEYQVATPVFKCDQVGLTNLLRDRKSGRVGATTVVFDTKGRALYFSKEVIPYTNENKMEEKQKLVYHHIGVYAYRAAALKTYLQLPPSHLEIQEGLEQLRFIENGVSVKCVVSSLKGKDFWELNNPSDVSIIENILKSNN